MDPRAERAVAAAGQDSHPPCRQAGGDQVGYAVTREVTDGHCLRQRAGDEVAVAHARVVEGAVTVAHQHADSVASRVGSDDVEIAVGVKVGNCHPDGGVAIEVFIVPCHKAPLPITHQHLNVGIAPSGGVNRQMDQVHVAVFVDVTDLERDQRVPGEVIDARLKSAVPCAQQDADGVQYAIGRAVAGVGCGEVEGAVLVEVPNHNGYGVHTGGEVIRCTEAAQTVAQQHAERAVVIRRGQVDPTVFIEVGRHNGLRICADTVMLGSIGREVRVESTGQIQRQHHEQ